MRMGIEILRDHAVNVDRRGIDADELKAILNGAWTYEQILAYADEMDKKIMEIYETSTLQHQPERGKLDKLLVDLLRKHFAI